jgi:hypothetical protein
MLPRPLPTVGPGTAWFGSWSKAMPMVLVWNSNPLGTGWQGEWCAGAY